MIKKDYIVAIRKILNDYCLTEEAKKLNEKRFPLERSPLWKRNIKELQSIYKEYSLLYSLK